jgi:hypothetical protein
LQTAVQPQSMTGEGPLDNLARSRTGLSQDRRRGCEGLHRKSACLRQGIARRHDRNDAIAADQDRTDWLAPGVTLALSGMTAITNLEHLGYALMPL